MSGTDGNLTLTANVQSGESSGYIANNAFGNADMSGVKTVVIGNGVTSIGDNAFYGCSGLNSVTIGNGVTTINQYAFYNCSGLTSLTFSEVSHVETIGQFAFEKCSSLESLTIPVSVTSIGAGAFASCTSLTTLSIPVSATIAEDAKPFKKSESITTVTITGTGVITSTNPINIAGGANNNNTVTTLIIGDDITGIGDNAFSSRSSSITTLTLGSKVETIGENAFRNCGNLGTVTFSSNPYIGANVFTDIKADAAVTMNLTGNEGETDEYWMTFYNLYYNFQVPATTQIFKAALTGSTLALTELTTDKIVKAGKPVILKSTTGPISLTLTSTASSNDFSGNDLKGVSNDAGLSGATDDIYVLNKKAGTGVGFYKLATSKTLGVGKAYLQTTSGSNFFGMDEETTNIGASLNDKGEMKNDNYFDLSGRRVMKPTKGLYIVNGKKIIIK